MVCLIDSDTGGMRETNRVVQICEVDFVLAALTIPQLPRERGGREITYLSPLSICIGLEA